MLEFTSYLLIGFWNYKDSANKAALKAFIANRVGDFGLLLALFSIFIIFGTLNINEIMVLVNSHVDTYFEFLGARIHAITLICILLFVGCMGKSAQFGLHVWLPDAMEGPHPCFCTYSCGYNGYSWGFFINNYVSVT